MHPLWILAIARSGSTFLSNLINQTKFLPGYLTEHLHPTIKQSYASKKDVLDNPPPFTKVLREHFEAYFTNDDRDAIEAALPGIRYVLLTRDNVDVAVSQYISFTLNKFGIKHRESPDVFLSRRIQIDKDKIYKMYQEVQRKKDDWFDYVHDREHITINFDELVQYPKQTLSKVLTFLNIAHQVERLPETDNEFVWPMPVHPAKEILHKVLKTQILLKTKLL